MTCERFREIVVGLDEVTAIRRRAEATHLDACAGCREWFARLAEGAADWDAGDVPDLAADVTARTTGAACDRARALMAAAVDEPPAAADSSLLSGHLAHCAGCRAFERRLADVVSALPAFAEMDPGPAFAAAVFARTSRRPARVTAWDRARAWWQAVVRRPRFAWEVAYVCTVLWLVVVGPPIAAYDWTTARVSAAARAEVPATLQEARTLRQQLMADVSRAAGGAVDAGRVRVERVARTWQERAMAWMNARVADVVDGVVATWHAMTDWLGSTEPESTRVRSSQ